MAIEHLTLDTFKTKIYDFEANTEWTFKGNRPVIIDFYANWCGPCKMVAPVLEELQEKYKDRIDIFKVDTEQEQALSELFKIRSIPSILFIPMDHKPQMAQGAFPMEGFEQAIADIFQL